MPTIQRTEQDSVNTEPVVIEGNKEPLEEEVFVGGFTTKETLEEEENEEVKEILATFDEYRKENGITDEEVEQYKKTIDERASKISDETFNTLIDNMIAASNVAVDERPKYKAMLLKKLKEQQAMVEEFEDVRTQFDKDMEKVQKEMDELFCNMKYTELLTKIQGLIDVAVKHNQKPAEIHFTNLYKEIDGIINLSNMRKNIKNIKNPANIFNTYEANFDKEFKKFYNNLGKTPNYRFVDPSKLLESLEGYLPEGKKEYAKIFIYSLCKYINPKGVENVDKNAVFLEGIFRIIYNLNSDKLEEHEKETFVNAVYFYVDELRNRQK